MKVTKKQKRGLSETLKDMLGKPAPVELVDQISADLRDRIAEGGPIPSYEELIVARCLQIALGPKPCQWAMELVWDRVEGKPFKNENVDKSRNQWEKKMDDVTAAQLNNIAATVASMSKQSSPQQASNPLAGLGKKR